MNPSSLHAIEARTSLSKGTLSARELAESVLENIQSRDGDLRHGKDGINAFLEVYEDVLSQADAADRRIQAGESLPLLGIPVALKDNILVQGRRASSASKILDGYVAPYDATVVTKLKEAGAVLVGRTNMDEFAMGASTENSAFGPTKNPHDPSRVPGGSSGGSAAVVASEMSLLSLGSDTGGSIRQPASFCGVVGMKPTYGRVSRSGLMALASSLDQIGPFAKTVGDAELLYRVIAGHDPLDSTSTPDDMYGAKKFTKTIGIPWSFVESEGVDPEVKENFALAVDKFASLGYEVRDVEMPHIKYSLSVYYIVMPAEASTNLARYDGVKYGLHKNGKDGVEDYFRTRGEGFGREVRRRVILGTYVLSSGYYDAYYGKAVELKGIITAELKKTFESVDLLLTPTSPTPAFKLGEKTTDPLSMYLADLFTVPANIAGLPSMSVPSGVNKDGLPLGVLLTADHGREEHLFRAGKDFSGE